ncbi:hypothetical protein F7734_44125 [Scytonema sp. UIC 10036]|uniref:hypothetical protein n=1 Tax=Scytonema sp. UIC 10036 TaxID=2304196 RepID=UPI0012DA8260|nr:hypothetical protein [Scytonema sp. UIC 10036]MUG98914.1 hypothetical protein [Scytonema sp. UIC 10036]
MAETTEHIGFRCPKDLIAVIEEQKSATGRGRTEVIVEMLRSSMPSTLVSDRGNLPTESAIYFVWGGQRLLYIGKTTNLRKRFVNHHRLADFVLAEKESRISWLPATAENLAAFEASLIEELEPELNAPLPKGTKTISFRCPEEMLEFIEQEARTSGVDKTAVIMKLLELGKSVLGNDGLSSVLHPSDSVNASLDERIQQALAPLQAQLDELRGKLTA